MPWIGKKKLVDSDKANKRIKSIKYFAISNIDCIIDFSNF